MAQGPPERFSPGGPNCSWPTASLPRSPLRASFRCRRGRDSTQGYSPVAYGKVKCLAQPKLARPSRDLKESGQMHSCAPHLLEAGHSFTRRAGHPSVWPFHEITFGVRPTSPSGANHFVACKHRDYRQNAGIYQDRLSLSCERWLAQRCSTRPSARPLYGGSYMFCQVARFYS